MNHRNKIIMLFTILISICLWWIGVAGAQPNGKYIVVFEKPIPDEVKSGLIQNAGGTVVKHLRLINGSAVVLPNDTVKSALAKRAEIKRIDDDIVFYATGKPQPPPPPAQVIPWGIATVRAPAAWSISKGTAVKVAIMDTGIDLTHPDLKANIKGGINTIKPGKSANDDNGHGTHVAGIVAAVNNAIGVVGVAPEVHLYAVKVLNAAGTGWLSDIIEGLQWCIDNQIKVINMSFGSNASNVSEQEAITKTYRAGITLVAAAGNDGAPNSVDYPGAYPEVIAVSALDANLNLASFSSYGPEVDITAPGAQIYSTYKKSEYTTMSGTSMATPHVTGVVALRLAQYPNQSPAEIKSVLQTTATNLGLSAEKQGAGLVNAEAVVQYPLFFFANANPNWANEPLFR
ncbi:MAG: S8 family peptidase [bacterium]|nr:S8 family peptidase [bacterium]